MQSSAPMEKFLDSDTASTSRVLSLNIFCEWNRAKQCRTNCPRIEVEILYPLSYSNQSSPSSISLPSFDRAVAMDVCPGDDLIHEASGTRKRDDETMDSARVPEIPCESQRASTGLLNLPIELRLKIYSYLLPPRTHKIVTQIPHNGFFYNTASIPEHSATSFYPFGRAAPKGQLTTYKVLTTNFRSDYPAPSIYPSILQTCRQIKEEAEPVLYGASQTVFDFGSHVDALEPFFRDRSALARRCIKNIRIAREIPCLDETESPLSTEIDPIWMKFCNFVVSDLLNLRSVDLTLWSCRASSPPLPFMIPSTISGTATTFTNEGDDEVASAALLVEQWKEWDWTRKLLNSVSTLKAKVTWWQFNPVGENGESSVDSWLAKRMAIDSAVKEKMIKSGILVECMAVI